jgi:hypothetical protein
VHVPGHLAEADGRVGPDSRLLVAEQPREVLHHDSLVLGADFIKSVSAGIFSVKNVSLKILNFILIIDFKNKILRISAGIFSQNILKNILLPNVSVKNTFRPKFLLTFSAFA